VTTIRRRETFPMRVRTKAISVAICLATISCGGGPTGPDSTQPDPTVTGFWQGQLSGPYSTASLELSEAASGEVSGDGTITTTAGDSTDVTVVGSHAFPRIALLLVGLGSEVVVFNGAVSENSITGTLNGSGFTDEQLILAKSQE
jgi:hypothetical protein